MMPIMSMTAYSRQTKRAAWGEIIWELRSVNHRFLDVSIRLPEELNELEMDIRALTRKYLGRGKIVASLFYMPGEATPFQLEINPAILQQLATAANKLKNNFDLSSDLIHLLKWPGLLNVVSLQKEELLTAALEVLNSAMEDLMATRQREGEELKKFIELKLQEINEYVQKIKLRLPQAQAAHKERLHQRLKDFVIEVDNQRLQQEIVFYLQKIDISEEVQRLETHITEMKRALKVGGIIGRRLDFIVQEMQRESNTLGNKINDFLIQQDNVEIKVLIEQIREQVQNIE